MTLSFLNPQRSRIRALVTETALILVFMAGCAHLLLAQAPHADKALHFSITVAGTTVPLASIGASPSFEGRRVTIPLDSFLPTSERVASDPQVLTRFHSGTNQQMPLSARVGAQPAKQFRGSDDLALDTQTRYSDTIDPRLHLLEISCEAHDCSEFEGILEIEIRRY